MSDNSALSESGVKVDNMGHNGSPKNSGGQKNAFGAAELGDDRMVGDVAPVGMPEDSLGKITKSNHAYEGGDDRLKGSEAISLKTQDYHGSKCRKQGSPDQRKMKKKLKSYRGAEEFRQIGRHRDDFGYNPHCYYGGFGKSLAAQFGEVLTGGDSKLGGKGLDKHRHKITGDDYPEEQVSKFSPALNIGGKIARIHVGDAGDEGRTKKGEET